MKEIICWLKNIYENITHWDFPFEVDFGHEWQDIEEHNNCKVIISKCERCGKTHIVWEEMATPLTITREKFGQFIEDVANDKYKPTL